MLVESVLNQLALLLQVTQFVDRPLCIRLNFLFIEAGSVFGNDNSVPLLKDGPLETIDVED